MIILRNGRAMLGDVTAELARLEQLLVDLRHIAAGHTPDIKNLNAAPVVDDWTIIPRLRPALTGFVVGHPRLTDGQLTVTSPLEILAPEFGWARTGSRMVRLGYQAGKRPARAN